MSSTRPTRPIFNTNHSYHSYLASASSSAEPREHSDAVEGSETEQDALGVRVFVNDSIHLPKRRTPDYTPKVTLEEPRRHIPPSNPVRSLFKERIHIPLYFGDLVFDVRRGGEALLLIGGILAATWRLAQHPAALQKDVQWINIGESITFDQLRIWSNSCLGVELLCISALALIHPLLGALRKRVTQVSQPRQPDKRSHITITSVEREMGFLWMTEYRDYRCVTPQFVIHPLNIQLYIATAPTTGLSPPYCLFHSWFLLFCFSP